MYIYIYIYILYIYIYIYIYIYTYSNDLVSSILQERVLDSHFEPES